MPNGGRSTSRTRGKGPQFVKFEDVSFAPIGNYDQPLEMAKEYDFIKEPLTAEQKKGLVNLIHHPGKS